MADKKKENKAQGNAKATAAVAKASDNREYRLKTLYNEEVAPALQKKFGYTNVHQIPRLEKIILNMGLGDVKDNAKSFQLAVEEMTQIAGQKPIITKARKSVANFKIREGMDVGCKVTLRGARMYDFLDKLMNVVMVRVPSMDSDATLLRCGIRAWSGVGSSISTHSPCCFSYKLMKKL